jgi:hypothetical protein
MANALVALATTTLATWNPTVTFSSIPQGYRDLRIVAYNVIDVTTANMKFRYNGDSGSNYSMVRFGFNYQPVTYSDGGTSTAIEDTRGYPTSSGGVMATIDILDYSATDKHKVSLSRHQGNPTINGQGLDIIAGRWASTAAITSITFSLSSGNFGQYATFSLYGVSA